MTKVRSAQAMTITEKNPICFGSAVIMPGTLSENGVTTKGWAIPGGGFTSDRGRAESIVRTMNSLMSKERTGARA